MDKPLDERYLQPFAGSTRFAGQVYTKASKLSGAVKVLYIKNNQIAVLILTPYARVVMSVLYFIGRRDIKYTLITLFVLILLTLSLLLH
jgi:uncharacterized membrane protein